MFFEQRPQHPASFNPNFALSWPGMTMPACPASRTSESVIPLQRQRYMGFFPLSSGGARRPVTILITIIKLTNNTPALSVCQEGKGGTGRVWRTYCLGKVGGGSTVFV